MTTHHICIEVKDEGEWSWYCISGIWYAECHVLNQLVEMPNKLVPVYVQTQHDEYLEEHSTLIDK